MADTLMALMIGIWGLLAGVLYIRNSARTLTEMDMRKRTIRFLKGIIYLCMGLFYVGVALHIIPIPSVLGVLVSRMLLAVLFALSTAYAYIER